MEQRLPESKTGEPEKQQDQKGFKPDNPVCMNRYQPASYHVHPAHSV
jgi:hypothetical protein